VSRQPSLANIGRQVAGYAPPSVTTAALSAQSCSTSVSSSIGRRERTAGVGAYRVSAAMMTSPAGTPAIAERNSHAAGFARLKVQPMPKRTPTISAGSPELT
jgi:hypothetical protein